MPSSSPQADDRDPPETLEDLSRLLRESCDPEECSRYALLGEIGRGTFGVVYAARDSITGDAVALKAVATASCPSALGDIWKEIEVLERMRRCPNAARFRRLLKPSPAWKTRWGVPPLVVVCMDLYDGGTLETFIYSDAGRCGLQQCKMLAFQLLAGLAYLHDVVRVAHRDLSPRNVLVEWAGVGDAPPTLRIADFGSCQPLLPPGAIGKPSTTRLYYVTRWSRPPEMWCDIETEDPEAHWLPLTDRSDIWSAGCLIAELLLRRPTLPCNDMRQFVDGAVAALGPPNRPALLGYASQALRAELARAMDDGPRLGRRLEQELAVVDPQAADLVLKMMQWQPARRPSARQLLHHPFFAGFRCRMLTMAGAGDAAASGSSDSDSEGSKKNRTPYAIAEIACKLRKVAAKVAREPDPGSRECSRYMAMRVFNALINNDESLQKYSGA